MNFQRSLLVLVCAVCISLQMQAQKVLTWNEPSTECANVYFDGYFNMALDITKVELKENETAVYATIRNRSDLDKYGKFLFPTDTHLLADGKRYAALSAEGVELGKSRQTEPNNRLDVVFHFQPLPPKTRSFDFVAGDYYVKGIKSVEEKSKELFPSYWRDVQSGEWVVAFFDDCAIYDQKIWELKAEAKNPAGKARITLTRNGEQVEMLMGKNRNGLRTLQVGKQKRTLSMITGRFLPDYPRKDERSDFKHTGFRPDTVTVVGWVRNMPEAMKGNHYLSFMCQDFVKDDQIVHYAQLDSLGRFAIRIPVINSGEFLCDWSRLFIRTVFEPGNTYFLLYDFKSGKRLFMGDDVRVQNELLKYPTDWFSEQMEEGDNFDRFLQTTDSLIRSSHAAIDSLLLQHPTLSSRFVRYRKDDVMAQAAAALGQARFCAPNYLLPANARQYATYNFWKKISNPYTLHRDWSTFLRDFIDDVVSANEVQRLKVFDVMNHIEELAANADELKLLKRFKAWSVETEARLAALESDEETQRLVNQLNKENADLIAKVNRILNSDHTQKFIREKVFIGDMKNLKRVTDSLGASPEVQSMLLCAKAYKNIDYLCRPLGREVMDSLTAWCKNPAELQKINERNRFYRDLAARQLNRLALKTDLGVDGLTEGEEMLRKITEPFRGKFVILDVWGTWCGPCKQALSHSQDLYAHLAKYDLGYVYLANHSPKDTWESVIKQYKVEGDNVLHYNLPDDQQKAIERYLSVSQYPTYKLIDPEGRVLDLKVDTRQLQNLEALLKQLTGK